MSKDSLSYMNRERIGQIETENEVFSSIYPDDVPKDLKKAAIYMASFIKNNFKNPYIKSYDQMSLLYTCLLLYQYFNFNRQQYSDDNLIIRLIMQAGFSFMVRQKDDISFSLTTLIDNNNNNNHQFHTAVTKHEILSRKQNGKESSSFVQSLNVNGPKIIQSDEFNGLFFSLVKDLNGFSRLPSMKQCIDFQMHNYKLPLEHAKVIWTHIQQIFMHIVEEIPSLISKYRPTEFFDNIFYFYIQRLDGDDYKNITPSWCKIIPCDIFQSTLKQNSPANKGTYF